jgi:hypothetical protein
MKTLNPKPYLIILSMILCGAFACLLQLTGAGGSGFVSGDLFFYSFIAVLVSLIPVFTLKGNIRKPAVLLIPCKPLYSRKKIIQHNDPLLM